MRRLFLRLGISMVLIGAGSFVPATMHAASLHKWDCATICPGGSCTATGWWCSCSCNGDYPQCGCILAT